MNKGTVWGILHSLTLIFTPALELEKWLEYGEEVRLIGGKLPKLMRIYSEQKPCMEWNNHEIKRNSH